MTAPVLPTRASLVLHRVDENTLVDTAVAAFQASVPEWVPQEGATEIVLIESLALLIGQQVYALNELPVRVLDALLGLRAIFRQPAVPAAGEVTVTLAPSTVGTRTVEEGTRFRVTVDTLDVDLVGVETVDINPVDSLTAVVHVVANTPGTAANGIPIDTPVQVLDPLAWVETAVISQQLGGGGDGETDEAFYPRAAAIMQLDHGGLVVDSQFANAALSVTGVGRAEAWGLWDSTGTPGTDGGHVTVAVAAPDGANVTAGIKTTVQETLAGNAVAGLTVHVIDFTKVPMSIALTYVLDPAYTAGTVTAAIEESLVSWLNPATWPLGQELTSANQIILRIGQVTGVTDVTALTGWAAVTGAATLPILSSLTITQT